MTDIDPTGRAFIDALVFGGAVNFDDAVRIAGLPEGTDGRHLARKFAQEIRKALDDYMMMKAPRAAQRLTSIVDDPMQDGASISMSAANSVLDRAGVVKKEKMEIETNMPNAILVLPAKNED